MTSSITSAASMNSNAVVAPSLDIQRVAFYGREEELELLAEAFAPIYNLASGPIQAGEEFNCDKEAHHVEVALLHGSSGSGKSTLIQKFKESVLAQSPECCFVFGKFEQTLEAVPYLAIVSAFSQICEYILNSPNSELIVEKLKNGMRPERRIVLSNTVEGFWDVFNDLPRNKRRPSFYDSNAFLRTQFIFRDFVRLLSTCVSPIVLVLEDLHWSDASSLQLIKTVISDQYSTFLFIGSYRSDQICHSHPLTSLVRSVNHSILASTDLYLEGFGKEIVNEIISHLLEQPPEDCVSLSNVVYAKTGGNIFFVLHYLQLIQKRGALFWSPENKQWNWTDVGSNTNSEESTDTDVVHIVAEELGQLSPKAQSLLMIASCLGSQFCVIALTCITSCINEVNLRDDLTGEDAIRVPSDDEIDDILATLQEAVNLRLVAECDELTYAFEHDRVQHAAYMSGTSDINKTHFKIGKILLQYSLGLGIENNTSSFLLAVTQLNQGSEIIKDNKAKARLAQLNLDAANCVLLKSGFENAIDYLQQGLDILLPTHRWHEHYDVTLKLTSTLAEVSCSSGDFIRCKHNIDEVVRNGKCFEDKFRIYFTTVQLLGLQNRFEDAFDIGKQILDSLGEKIVSSKLRLIANLIKVRNRIRNGSIDKLVYCPLMVQREKLQACKILRSLVTLAWQANQGVPLIHFQMRLIQITIKYGASPYSSFALACLGMVFASMGKMSEAYHLGVVATKMAQKMNHQGCDAMTSTVVHAFLNYLKQPMHASIDPLRLAHQSAMASGDIEGALYSAITFINLIRDAGRNLEFVTSETQRVAELIRDYSSTHMSTPQLLMMILPQWQFALNITGKARDPLKLTGTAMEEDTFVAECIDEHIVRGMKQLYDAKMKLGYYFGDNKIAFEASKNLRAIQDQNECPSYTNVRRSFFVGLVAFEMYRQTKRKKHLNEAVKCIKMLQKWHMEGIPNIEHMILILKAETVSLGTDVSERIAACEAAIECCRRDKFRHDEALANHRAALFCLAYSDIPSTSKYMFRAKTLYMVWGATALVKHIAKKYAYLFYDHDAPQSSEAGNNRLSDEENYSLFSEE